MNIINHIVFSSSYDCFSQREGPITNKRPKFFRFSESTPYRALRKNMRCRNYIKFQIADNTQKQNSMTIVGYNMFDDASAKSNKNILTTKFYI